jgi:hypothetical protein
VAGKYVPRGVRRDEFAIGIVACDIGGAITLCALLLEHATYSDLTLFDAVTGGDRERNESPPRESPGSRAQATCFPKMHRLS